MGIFDKKGKAADSLTDFEKVYIYKKAKPNPVIRAGSAVLYVTVIIAVVACIFMAVLDKTGVAPSPVPQKDKTADKAQSVDVSSHPESLQKLYSENFETADFVASYFKEKDKVREVSLKKYKSVRDVPLFIQWDKQWGYLPYGDDIVGVNGDGPMCLAMAGYHLTRDEKFSPDKVVSFAEENDFYKKGKGTLDTLMTKGASALGLTAVKIDVDAQSITDALREDKLVICYMNKGRLSTSPHYILIRKCEDDTVFINDPTSVVNSEKQWRIEDIIPETEKAWAVYK